MHIFLKNDLKTDLSYLNRLQMYKIINICRNTQCFSNLKVQFRSVKNGKFVHLQAFMIVN